LKSRGLDDKPEIRLGMMLVIILSCCCRRSIGMCFVERSNRSPNELAGAADSIVVAERALNDVGLLDLRMLVHRQSCTRLPFITSKAKCVRHRQVRFATDSKPRVPREKDHANTEIMADREHGGRRFGGQMAKTPIWHRWVIMH